MSDDTYKGESNAKKIARFFFWNWSVQEVKNDRKVPGPAVVLASRELGDVRCLKGFGFRDVIAVERNRHAYAAAVQKDPNADVRLGDVRDILATMPGKCSTVFLDFCSPLSAEVIETTGESLSALAPDGVLAVGLLKGREQDWVGVVSDRPNRRERRMVRAAARHLASSGAGQAYVDAVLTGVGERPIEPRKNILTSKLESHGLGPDGQRAFLLQAYLRGRASRMGVDLRPEFYCSYQSRTADSKGVPMVIVGYRVFPMGKALPKLKSQVYAVTDDNIRRFAFNVLKLGDEESAESVAAWLNIDVRTAVAWKAHATRGTYEPAAE